jgi:hypothetical protein
LRLPAALSCEKRFRPYFFRPIAAAIALGFLTPFLLAMAELNALNLSPLPSGAEPDFLKLNPFLFLARALARLTYLIFSFSFCFCRERLLFYRHSRWHKKLACHAWPHTASALRPKSYVPSE